MGCGNTNADGTQRDDKLVKGQEGSAAESSLPKLNTGDSG